MADAAASTTRFPFSVRDFNQLPTRVKLAGMIGVAVAVAVVVGTWLWARQPDYATLFANLSEQDGGQIVTILQQQNIPYRITDGGGAIQIPATQVHEIRLRLAAQGLPKGGLVGFEVMENQKLGASQFQEQVNYQRALEGELARTISTISAVRGARVHLAIPKQSAFLRDEQKPSASVLLNLQPGRTLDGTQLAGVVHLVSSSVPDLNPVNVSVVDQDGNLLSQSPAGQQSGLDSSQIKFVRELESGYIKRIEAILTPVVGRGNFKAQVAADVDFSQSDQVAETYRPNPSPDTAIRSQQTNESGSVLPPAMGVPGALSNQPPAPATAPIVTPAPGTGAPGALANTATSPAATPQNYTRNATTNYEVDKTIKHTRTVPGSLRRLSVAVVINQKQEPGKPKPVPLSANEMQQFNDLIKEAVGYDKTRGDSINVANAAFTATKDELPQMPFWQDPWLLGTARDAGRYIAALIVAYLVWTRLLRPLFRKLAELPRHSSKEEMALDTMTGSHGTASFDAKISHARALAKENPQAVANVIKEWVGGNESR
ncbi:MAG: flagellar M-ring protein FliF [Proteobacteria bacterium]|nr:flagellar M-ring protein FliF [Pseudomonadota bacterium]HQR05016.1 flagellar basal-body MS-ring/collar protein FliF [Rhodocyclaceae bacterium]